VVLPLSACVDGGSSAGNRRPIFFLLELEGIWATAPSSSGVMLEVSSLRFKVFVFSFFSFPALMACAPEGGKGFFSVRLLSFLFFLRGCSRDELKRCFKLALFFPPFFFPLVDAQQGGQC